MFIATGAKKLLGGMTYTDWAFLHLNATFALLWALPFSMSKDLQALVGWHFMVIWTFVVFAGSATAIVGIVMSSHSGLCRRRGFLVEAVGQMLTAAGPLSYIGMQIGIMAQTGAPPPVSIGFAYLLCSALVCRIVMIYGAAHRGTIPVTFPRGDS